MFRPEGVVAVTEVGVAGAEGQIHQPAENPVPETPADRDVVAPAAVREAGPLGKVGSGHQGGHEANDLGPRGGTVAVHHHDDVAGTGLEPGEEGVALALPRLCDDFDVGSALPGDGDGLVHGVTVHQDHFVDPIGKRAQHHWQVPRLVLDRDHHADRRHDRQLLREGPVLSEQALVWAAWPTVQPPPDVRSLQTPLSHCAGAPPAPVENFPPIADLPFCRPTPSQITAVLPVDVVPTPLNYLPLGGRCQHSINTERAVVCEVERCRHRGDGCQHGGLVPMPVASKRPLHDGRGHCAGERPSATDRAVGVSARPRREEVSKMCGRTRARRGVRTDHRRGRAYP